MVSHLLRKANVAQVDGEESFHEEEDLWAGAVDLAQEEVFGVGRCARNLAERVEVKLDHEVVAVWVVVGESAAGVALPFL